jgi:hypothetical protein
MEILHAGVKYMKERRTSGALDEGKTCVKRHILVVEDEEKLKRVLEIPSRFSKISEQSGDHHYCIIVLTWNSP